jgi:hypothetical protein
LIDDETLGVAVSETERKLKRREEPEPPPVEPPSA